MGTKSRTQFKKKNGGIKAEQFQYWKAKHMVHSLFGRYHVDNKIVGEINEFLNLVDGKVKKLL